MTIPQLVKVITEREDFVEFSSPLEKQLVRIANGESKKLFFQIDVSGGCRQMTQMVWTKIESESASRK